MNYRGGYGKFNMKENFPDIGGRKIVAYFEFDPKASQELEVKVALSGVSTAGALKNLQAEAASAGFDELASRASNTWNKALSVIEANGNDDQLAMLYTSLYHTMINPCVYTDVDGQYRGIDQNIHTLIRIFIQLMALPTIRFSLFGILTGHYIHCLTSSTDRSIRIFPSR